jgi:hypothetical protein
MYTCAAISIFFVQISGCGYIFGTQAWFLEHTILHFDPKARRLRLFDLESAAPMFHMTRKIQEILGRREPRVL